MDKWNVKGQLADVRGVGMDEVGDRIVAAILDNRRVIDHEGFLSPPRIDQEFLARVQDLVRSDLDLAVETIRGAIESNLPIVIHGDYDVDGICATAILWEAIYHDLGYRNVHPFIPHRVDHGYGLSKTSIDAILSLPAVDGSSDVADGQDNGQNMTKGLLITVDCGITAGPVIGYARGRGLDVIVTDHHTRPTDAKTSPSACPVLHTHDLCGAGIAWVLARTLYSAVPASPSSTPSGAQFGLRRALFESEPQSRRQPNRIPSGMLHYRRRNKLNSFSSLKKERYQWILRVLKMKV